MDSRKILSSDQKLNLYKIVDNPSSFSSKIITLLPLEREYLYNIIDPQLIIDLSFPIINEFKNLPNTDFITHLDYIDIKLNQVEKQILHSMYYLIATKFQLKAKDYIIGDVSSIVLNKHTSDFYDVYLLKKYILNSELFVEFNESASKEDIKENNFWYNQDKYYFYKQYGSTKILLNQLNIKSYYDGDHYYVRRDLFYQKFYNQINNLPFTFPIHATMHNLQDLDDNYLTFNELKNDSSPTT